MNHLDTGALRLPGGTQAERAGVGAGVRTMGGSVPGRQGPVGALTPSVTTRGILQPAL